MDSGESPDAEWLERRATFAPESLEDVSWPSWSQVSAATLGPTLGAAALIEFVTRSQPVHAMVPVLVLLAGSTWIIIPLESRHRAAHLVAALIPLVVVNVFADALGIGSVSATAPQSSLTLVLLLAGQMVCTGSARLAGVTVLMCAAVLAGRCIAAGQWAPFFTWFLGLGLAVATGYALRVSAIRVAQLNLVRMVMARQVRAEERRRIARDVHDVVAHTMSVTMLSISAARMTLARSPEAAEAALIDAENQGRASLADIRRTIEMLRAEDERELTDQAPGFSQIPELIERYRIAGLGIDVRRIDTDLVLGSTAGIAAYRTVQESLTNAVRHGTGPVVVEIWGEDRNARIRVANSINLKASDVPGGSGLKGLRERLAACGGHISTSADGARWVVEAGVPLARPRPGSPRRNRAAQLG